MQSDEIPTLQSTTENTGRKNPIHPRPQFATGSERDAVDQRDEPLSRVFETPDINQPHLHCRGPSVVKQELEWAYCKVARRFRAPVWRASWPGGRLNPGR